MSNTIPVKYLGNADDRATGALTFLDDDRPDILIEGTGLVTEDEFASLSSQGILLERLKGKEGKEAAAEAEGGGTAT